MKIETSNGSILEFKDDDVAEQVLRHKPGWKEASEKPQRRGKGTPEGDSGSGVM